MKTWINAPHPGQFRRRWKRSSYSRHGLDSAGSVGVLVVYPAVDSVFQNAVMAIAEFLQSHRELNVIIDVWQRGGVAEQGPLRWLNSQVGCAQKVLIILPLQSNEFKTDTGNKPIGTFSYIFFQTFGLVVGFVNACTLTQGSLLQKPIPLSLRIFSQC